MMKPLPDHSVAESLADAFCRPNIPVTMRGVCDALMMDFAGLCVAARNTDYVVAAVAATSEPGDCTMIGHAGAWDPATAALVNGTAAHGEDYDDTFEGGPVHAGAAVIPAVLAAAERHRLSGEDLVAGVAVGCEIMCRLCLVAPKRVHQAGFHPTAVFGALGAAAGVATAMRLSPTQWVDAIGIAGSMASGIIEYLAEGTWTKRMHPGWAAQGGYRAARLALAGFKGPRTVLDGEHGFFHAFARTGAGNFAAMLDGAGDTWLAAGLAFKPYACGTMAHPYLDCARALVKAGVDPETIESIECETAEGIVHRLWEPLADKQRPPNGYAAKFSIPYAIAVGMLRDDAGLREYEEAVVADPRVRALASKVRYVVDPDNPYPDRFTGHVRVTLVGGEIREHRQDHFRGGVSAPLSAADLKSKFRANCVYGGWSGDETQRALDALRRAARAAMVDVSELRR